MKTKQTLEENLIMYDEKGMEFKATPNDAIEFWKRQAFGMSDTLDKQRKFLISKNKDLQKLYNENEKLKEALESIAFNECPEQGTEEYWTKISSASIIETIVNDTNIARKALKYLLSSRPEKLSDS